MRRATPIPPDVRTVRPLSGRAVRIEYADGTWAEVDLTPLLRGPLFQGVAADDEEFAAVFVDEMGTLAWPGGADLAPEVLYELAAPHLRPAA